MTEEVKVDIGYVTDTLAVAAVRKHGVALPNQTIKYYDLSADTEVEMPIDHALRFLCDPAFIVKDANKKVLKPMPKQEKTTHIAIPEGFVMAELGELSREALFTRCKVLPGSEHIHPKKTSNADMIAFLKSVQPKVVKSSEIVAEASKADLDRMVAPDPEELRRAVEWMDLMVAEDAGTERKFFLTPATTTSTLTADTASYTLSTLMGTSYPSTGILFPVAAYLRDTNGEDEPLDIISRAEYEELKYKEESGPIRRLPAGEVDRLEAKAQMSHNRLTAYAGTQKITVPRRTKGMF